MSRRRRVYKKEEKLDSRYGSAVVARLISTVMKRGKKSLAERIVYTAIDKSREGSDAVDPLEVVNKALENVKPRLEVKSRRVGGATYQVPMEVTPARQVSLALRWIVTYADNRRGMPMADALAHELKDALPVRATRSRSATTPTRWRRRTAPSPISAGNQNFHAHACCDSRKTCHRRIRIRRTASFRSRGRGTSGLPRTSTPARRR